MKASRVLMFLAPIFTLSPVVDAGNIKLCVKMAGRPIPGAFVECFDDDYNNDDFMTDGITGSDGCVMLTYQTKITSAWNCWNRWDGCLNSNPDIYCEVSADCLAPKKTAIKSNHDQNTLADFGTVVVKTDKAFCGDVEWNGCGVSPLFPPWLLDVLDSVSGFEDSCNRHDVCYADCTKTRSQCDTAFKSGMYARCNGRSTCQMIADIFYTAVRQGGRKFCGPDRKSCNILRAASSGFPWQVLSATAQSMSSPVPIS